MVDKTNKNSGFALLISLIVVGAILSVGLVILDLSIKQVRLAATTKDSEIAFHAANAGMECARYWRRAARDTLTIATSTTSNIECFGATPFGGTDVDDLGTAVVTGSSDGEAMVYEYEFTWNGGGQCSSITKVIAVSDLSGDGVEIRNMRDLIPGYPSATLDCPAASECTAVAVEGFNRGCSQKNSFGTIQREVLLEF